MTAPPVAALPWLRPRLAQAFASHVGLPTTRPHTRGLWGRAVALTHTGRAGPGWLREHPLGLRRLCTGAGPGEKDGGEVTGQRSGAAPPMQRIDELIQLVVARDLRFTERLNEELSRLSAGAVLRHSDTCWPLVFPDNMAAYLLTLADHVKADPALLGNLRTNERYHRLLARACTKVDGCSAWGLTSLASSLHVLREDMHSPVWAQLLPRLHSARATLSPTQAARISWHVHFCALKQPPARLRPLIDQAHNLIGQLAAQVANQLPDIPPNDLARMAFVVAQRSLFGADTFWAAVHVDLTLRLSALDNDALWMAAVALAAAQIRDAALWEQLAAITTARLPGLEPTGLVNLADALSRGAPTTTAQAAVQAIGGEVEARALALSPRMLLLLVGAFGRTGVVPSHLQLAALASSAVGRLAFFRPDELAQLGQVFGLVGYRDERLYSALAVEAVGRVAKCLDGTLHALLQGLALAGYVHQPLLEQVDKHVCGRDPTKPLGLLLAPSFARLNYLPSYLDELGAQGAIVQAAQSRETFGLAVGCGWALCVLRHMHGPSLAAVVAAANGDMGITDDPIVRARLAQIDIAVSQDTRLAATVPRLKEKRRALCRLALGGVGEVEEEGLRADVGRIVGQYGLGLVGGVRTDEGYVLHWADKRRKLAIQVFPSSDFLLGTNADRPQGHVVLQLRQLRQAGWRVVAVSQRMWLAQRDDPHRVSLLSLRMAAL